MFAQNGAKDQSIYWLSLGPKPLKAETPDFLGTQPKPETLNPRTFSGG